MGIDINMKMYKPDNSEVENFHFWDDGSRNYDWFEDISGNGNFFKYDNFPCFSLWKEDPIPEDFKKVMDNRVDYGAYDFKRLNVGDFLDWFEKMLPYKRAGFVDRYTLWKIENGWEIPDPYEIATYSSEDHNIFTEYEYHDPSTELYEYIKENNFPRENNIFYYFDH